MALEKPSLGISNKKLLENARKDYKSMNLLETFTKIIKKECDNAIKYKIYGTDSFHIESIERVEDKNGALNFLVTTWNNENSPTESSRKTKEMNLMDLMDLLGRVISDRAITDAVMSLK
jgi:hypothetical protein